MQICRSMSLKELCLFLDGITIVPSTNRQLRKGHSMTDCRKEVCFFGMENEAFANDWNEVVAVFEVPDEQLRKGWGIYSWSFGGSFTKDEYYLPSYSKENAKLLYWYYSDPEAYDSETDRRLTDYVYGPYWYGMDKNTLEVYTP